MSSQGVRCRSSRKPRSQAADSSIAGTAASPPVISEAETRLNMSRSSRGTPSSRKMTVAGSGKASAETMSTSGWSPISSSSSSTVACTTAASPFSRGLKAWFQVVR